MELVKHIRDLLYHHDCVVVPGFGGFVTNERSARIDRAGGNFYPPSRDVGFNVRLDHNDGLLISYLSARLSVNYVDARKLVESFTEEIRKKLESGRTVHFEGIGQFSVDRHQNLQFDPEPSANFLTDAYGLSFFKFQSLGSVDPSGKKQREFSESATAGLSHRAKRLLRYAAVGIPLIAALSWGAMNIDVVREFDFDISSLNPFTALVDSGLRQATPPRTDTVADSDSPVAGKLDEMSSQRRALMYAEDPVARGDVARADKISVAKDIPVNEQDDLSRDEPVPEEFMPERKHYLVAGSFSRKQNALFLMERLRQEGYTTQLMESEKGMHRVSIFSSDSRAEALQKLYHIRSEAGRPDVWLLSKNTTL